MAGLLLGMLVRRPPDTDEAWRLALVFRHQAVLLRAVAGAGGGHLLPAPSAGGPANLNFIDARLA